MTTNFEKTANEIAMFLKEKAEMMLAPNYVDDGTFYYLRLPNQLGVCICFDAEGYLEASVRVRDSSYFADDWLYVDEASFVGIENLLDINRIARYFMSYIEAEEERTEIISNITDIMYSENLTEFSIEKKDGTSLTILYNLRDLCSKLIDENDDEVTYNANLDILEEMYEDLKEEYDW